MPRAAQPHQTMILSNVPATFWQKLFDKGVEITADIIGNVLSAGIVAGVGLLLWRWNRKRESNALQKDRCDQLKAIIQQFAEQAGRAVNGVEAARIARNWRAWLERESILSIGDNSVRSLSWENADGRFASLEGSLKFSKVQESLVKDIRATEIPAAFFALYSPSMLSYPRGKLGDCHHDRQARRPAQR
jgi:hypothetical protein